MRTYRVCVPALSLLAMLGACSDGSMPGQSGAGGSSSVETGAGVTGTVGGMGGAASTSTSVTSSGVTTGIGGSTTVGGSTSDGTTTSGSTTGGVGASVGGMGGSATSTDGSEVGTVGSMGGMGGTSGTSSDMGTGGTGAVGPTGPFKVLILSTVLEFGHDSIPDCQQMVADLGQLDPDSNNQWTTEIETDNLAHFTNEGLSEYGLLFWCNPTGTVFSGNPQVQDKPGAMQALQDYVEGGGAWAGVHSASDFEKTNGFPWFVNTLMGGYFQSHDPDGTQGSIQVQTEYASHPVATELSLTYSTQDEWYYMNRDISAQPGFEIIQRLNSDNRPISWIKEVGAGRMFYTVRGHNKSVYREEEFRKIVQNGIMWVTRRTN